MNHGDHGGHDMPMPSGPKCSMNMLWNTQVADTCVVFRSWHISGPLALALSCVAIAGLGVLYEYTRVASARVDRRIAATLSAQGKGKASTAVGAAAEAVAGRCPVHHRGVPKRGYRARPLSPVRHPRANLARG